MRRKQKQRKPKPGLDTVYFRSLNALVDRLFGEAAKQKLTWIEMAELSGLARETIHRLGTRITKYPQFRTIELLANALGGRIEYATGTERRRTEVRWTPKLFNGRRKEAA
jgi:hypothetical protein